jgi:hypothetical protein
MFRFFAIPGVIGAVATILLARFGRTRPSEQAESGTVESAVVEA